MFDNQLGHPSIRSMKTAKYMIIPLFLYLHDTSVGYFNAGATMRLRLRKNLYDAVVYIVSSAYNSQHIYCLCENIFNSGNEIAVRMQLKLTKNIKKNTRRKTIEMVCRYDVGKVLILNKNSINHDEKDVLLINSINSANKHTQTDNNNINKNNEMK